MDGQQLKDWRETALYVEQERLRMLKEAGKEQRRERIATAIMAGIYANPAHAEIDDKMAALCAIDGADALINALDEATGKPEYNHVCQDKQEVGHESR